MPGGKSQMSDETDNKLWGGRFTGPSDATFRAFNDSFRFDRRLFAADVRGSIAHCGGLQGAGVLSDVEANQIQSALNTILETVQTDPAQFDQTPAEDVHSFVESRLIAIVGEVGRKLHTGRSRNDQVATDLRLWLRDEIDALSGLIEETQRALLDLAEANREVVMPGYTHLQRAQPILFAHWCLAYFEMLARDRERLVDVRRRVNVLPLGSAALAGTSFPIDRDAVARALGFASIAENSLDAVSDRDFCLEFAGAAAIMMTHLSRIAEDIVLYTTNEFGFFELSDAVATGSSLMPQKKNPDSMELVRGKAGRVFGHLMALLTVMKGLPLAYNKDMQEDKESIFDTVDTANECLSVTSTVLRNLSINNARARAAAGQGYMNATELADYLVKKSVPFREAHETVGRIVRRAIESECELQELPLDELKSFSALIDQDVFAALSLENTLATKSQTGGTAPQRVEAAIAAAQQRIAHTEK